VIRKGPIEVVDYAMDTWLAETKATLEAMPLKEVNPIKARIHTGIKTRLECELDYIGVWPGAMALGLQPANL
jgi:hypothetical protein